jgi:hypothetical protein
VDERTSHADNRQVCAFQIGSPQAAAAFRAEHRAFFDGADVLEAAFATAYERPFSTSDNAAAVIFFLGSRCVEDFREVALLAAHSHGWGATAHLRGMYERAVTCAYLATHPGEVDPFVEYDLVRRWRVSQKIKETFNIDAEDEAKLQQLEQDYAKVVDQFRVPQCKNCKTTRINHSWTRLDFVSMAARVGALGRVVVPGYYMPSAQAHATAASALYRLSEDSDGSFFVDPTTNEQEAKRSFQFAHLIILGVLTTQHEFFKLTELDEILGKAWEHYRSAWGYEKTAG